MCCCSRIVAACCMILTFDYWNMSKQLCTLKKEWRLTPSAAGGSGGIGGATGGIRSSGGDGLGLGSSRQGTDGGSQSGIASTGNVELDDLKKIRKVQGFFRGWLCRHRWKVIVEEYIKSPHAESMRKRNRWSKSWNQDYINWTIKNSFWFDWQFSLVFRMLEDEEENVQQLEILVARFYRPFKMAASSKKWNLLALIIWFSIKNQLFYLFFKKIDLVLGRHVRTKTLAPSFWTLKRSFSCTRSSTKAYKLVWITGPHWFSVMISL